MLKELVAYSGIVLVLSSTVLFAARSRLRSGHWLASLGLIGAISAAAWAIHATFAHSSLPFAATIIASLSLGVIVTALFEDWTAAGHAAFTAISGTTLIFLVYVGYVIRFAELGPWSLVFAVLLLVLQVAALVLLVANMFEVIDVVCRTRWNRQQGPKIVAGYAPKVSLHVPTHSEPPELVIETLSTLARLEYDNYEVLVIDNNTVDEDLWRPVEAHCAQLGSRFRFFHLMPWPGYKSGALNFALSQTAPDAEIIAVVDADYVVESNFLSELVGHFADASVAFVQTPQDYRDQAERGRYGKALYFAYLYFFEISMATRNEYNGIIYAGTMGLIRRSALERVGGWDEWCVTEDAEVSLRLLDAGYESVYVPRTYGRGIMPLDYAGLKKQRFRWAFGGMQILRKHAGKLLNPWSAGKLSWSQRFAYLNGGLQWLNDPMAFGFSIVLLVGAGALLVGKSLQSQPLSGATMLMAPLFILFAVMRFLWAFRLRARCSWSRAIDALLILLGLTWVVALACSRGLVAKHGVFLRTPKQAKELMLRDAVRIVWFELLAGTVCLSAAGALLVTQRVHLVSAWGLVVLMLIWQSVTYLSAVCSSVWSYLESRPPGHEAWFYNFRNLGHRSNNFITEARGAVSVLILMFAVAGLYYFARISAPLMERIQWADPLHRFISARSVNRSSDLEASSAAVLVQEAEAAKRGDVDASIRLWAPDGTVVDANFKPQANGGDRTWRGISQIKQRYVQEFQERHYKSLYHLNLRVEMRDDEAVIINDLSAVFQSEGATHHVSLSKSDRWVLRRTPEGWKIARLEVNRVSSPSARQVFVNNGVK
jgi:cellulose synthase/poly-beta-1,6-N-acetylglucosamine synthase-like glycosyltransferase/ketosteroid isomerase-like protein